MEYSSYQKDIINCFENTNDNICVNALAGSGKSFVLLELAKRVQKGKCIYAAFNKAIAESMKKKITNPKVKVYTMHSIGLQILKHNMGEKITELDTKSIFGQIRKAMETTFGVKLKGDVADYLVEQFYEFYNKFRLTFLKIEERQKLVNLVNDHDLFQDPDFVGQFNSALVFDCLAEIEKNHIESFQNEGKFDFTDMLYLPLKYLETNEWKVAGHLYCDVLLTDETQDFSRAQALIAKYIKKKNGRIVFVGDVYQSIYLFAGSHSGSIDYMKRLFTPCSEFNLPINYRCPISHLLAVNDLYKIPILPRFNAPKGKITYIGKKEAIELCQPEDMVIGRKNKWLIPFALECMKQEKKIFLKDKEFVDKLIRTIEKKNYSSYENLTQGISSKVIEYLTKLNLILTGLIINGDTFVEDNESNRQIASAPTDQERKRKSRSISQKLEIYETIDLLLKYYKEPTQSVEDFITFIRKAINTENPNGCVYISSIHGAKGLEAKNSYVLNENEILYQLGRGNAEATKQEENLAYIAHTRAMENLYLVAPEGDEYD